MGRNKRSARNVEWVHARGIELWTKGKEGNERLGTFDDTETRLLYCDVALSPSALRIRGASRACNVACGILLNVRTEGKNESCPDHKVLPWSQGASKKNTKS